MSEPEHRVVPLPSSFELREGSLPITALTRIVIADEHEHDHQHDQTVNHLIGDVQRATGIHLARTATAAAGDIELRLDGDPGQLGPEGYALDIDEQAELLRMACGTARARWCSCSRTRPSTRRCRSRTSSIDRATSGGG